MNERADGHDLARALADPAAYPDDASAARGVRWIQTHISHVFLTAERVYKLRKAVRPSFLDFSTQEARNADCLRELALNRRLAPDVYLGVAPILESGGALRVGRPGEQLQPRCEHVVVMRRLPDGRDALSLLERGELGAREIDALAARIAAFHATHGLGRPAPFSPEAWLERTAAPMRANCAALHEAAAAGVIAAHEIEQLAAETESALARHAERLEARRREGRAVDGHGDLHLQHAWFERSGGDAESATAPRARPELALIDCIEFSEELRRIDAASEVAFLAMDLRYRGARSLAERFLRRYAALRDDFGLYGVVDLFAAYRAAVRAKVAALAARDAAIEPAQRERAAESTGRHVALARELLVPPAPGTLLLVCGSVGTGKSTVAEEIASAADGVVIASDRTRKALAGLAPESRSGSALGAGLYAQEVTERVYAALLERAAPVLAAGRPALLDATYALAAQRSTARRFAEERGVRALLVEVTCAEEVARARVAARAARGDDPSDAGPELVGPSRARFEAPREWSRAERFEVATDAPDWRERARDVARGLRPA